MSSPPKSVVCPRCGSNGFTKFRYMNNRTRKALKGLKGQLRYECNSNECLDRKEKGYTNEFTASNKYKERGPYRKRERKLHQKELESGWKDFEENHGLVYNLPNVLEDYLKVKVVDGTLLEISGTFLCRFSMMSSMKLPDIIAKVKLPGVEENNIRFCVVDEAVMEINGTFCHRSAIPTNADIENVKAVFGEDVLNITIPKYEKEIPINLLFTD